MKNRDIRALPRFSLTVVMVVLGYELVIPQNMQGQEASNSLLITPDPANIVTKYTVVSEAVGSDGLRSAVTNLVTTDDLSALYLPSKGEEVIQFPTVVDRQTDRTVVQTVIRRSAADGKAFYKTNRFTLFGSGRIEPGLPGVQEITLQAETIVEQVEAQRTVQEVKEILRDDGSSTLKTNRTVLYDSQAALMEALNQPAQVVTWGIHQKMMQKNVPARAPDGSAGSRVATYIELGTGLAFQDETGQWHDSVAEFEVIEGSVVARRTAHKVTLKANPMQDNPVEVVLPDGNHLRSRVLGLGYFDRSSGKSAIFAELQDSQAEISADGKSVSYPDTFHGISASLRYRLMREGLEQDVILNERPASGPESYGLNAATTQIEVVTEFFPAQPPQVSSLIVQREEDGQKRVTMVEPDVTDAFIDFGSMQIGRGRAFSEQNEDQAQAGVAVAKHWEVIDGRTVLFEAVSYPDLKPLLEKLAAPPVESETEAKPQASITRMLPKRRIAAASKRSVHVAQTLNRGKGVVLDYSILGSATNVTLASGVTYVLNSGSANLSGNTVIQGGTVVKYGPGTQLDITGGLTCPTSGGKAYFVARTDNSVGEFVAAGSTSGHVAYCALDLFNVTPDHGTFSNLEIRNATIGVNDYSSYWTHTFTDCRVTDTGIGFKSYWTTNIVQNLSICNVQTNTIDEGGHGRMTETGTSVYCAPPVNTSALVTSVTSFGVLRNDWDGWVGFQFTVGDNPITVSSLGRWIVSGNHGTHVLKLFLADGTAFPNGETTIDTVGKSAGQFAYASLPAPVTLTNHVSYALMSQEASRGDQWYDYAGTAITLDPVANGGVAVWAYPTYPPYYGAQTARSYGPVNLTSIAPNTAPTISAIADQTINQNSSTGSIRFTISDAETPAGSLILSAVSSDQTIIPNANVTFGGSGANRTVTMTSINKSGSSLITITVSDGSLTANRPLTMNVKLPISGFAQNFSTDHSSATVSASSQATATVYYTTDGSDPTQSSSSVAPVVSSSATVVKARAFQSGYTPSDVLMMTPIGTTASVSFTPNGHNPIEYSNGPLAVLMNAESGATIWYKAGASGSWFSTTSGSSPSVDGIDSGNGTIQAYAYTATKLRSAITTSAEYSFRLSQPISSVSYSADHSSGTITLNALSGSTIRYTADGATPPSASSTAYSGPLTFLSPTKVLARAYKTGYIGSGYVSAWAARLPSAKIVTTAGVLSGDIEGNNAMDVWLIPNFGFDNAYGENFNASSWSGYMFSRVNDAPNANFPGAFAGSIANNSYLYSVAVVPVSYGRTYSTAGWYRKGTAGGSCDFAGLLNVADDGSYVVADDINGQGYLATYLTAPMVDGAYTAQVANTQSFANLPPESYFNIFTPLVNFNRAAPIQRINQANVPSDLFQPMDYAVSPMKVTAINGNTLTLQNSYHGPTLPIGTPVCRREVGAWYQYQLLSCVDVPTTWTYYSTTFSSMRPGTESVALMDLTYSGTTRLTGHEFWEGSASQRPQLYYTLNGNANVFSAGTATAGPLKLSLDGTPTTINLGQRGANYFDSPVLQRTVTFKVAKPQGLGGPVVDPASSGLAGRWRFDEGAGTVAADDSGNGNNGTLVNGPAWTSGQVAGGLRFDGIDDYVTVPDSPALEVGANGADLSVSFWLKLKSGATGSWRALMRKGAGDGDRTFAMYMRPSDNGIHYRISTATYWDEGGSSVGTVPLNEWVHVAYVKVGNKLRLYLNARQDSEATLTGTSISNTGPLYLGKMPEYAAGTSCDLDELHIYNRALSASEIAGLAGLTPQLTSTLSSDGTQVTITPITVTAGASIYYTTDGSEPTTSSSLYTGGASGATFVPTVTTKWKGFKNNYTPSDTVTVPGVPNFSPAGGTYSSGQTVTITAPAGAQLKVFQPNLNVLDPSTWVLGSQGEQPGFYRNGDVTENRIEMRRTPYGTTERMWVGYNLDTDPPGSASDGDGGWNAYISDIDSTKLYRFSVWMRKLDTTPDSSSGYSYLGCAAYGWTNVSDLTGTSADHVNINPYFWDGMLPLNEWHLIVGYIHPAGDLTTTHSSRVYDIRGNVVFDHSNSPAMDFRWTPGATSTYHRAYLFYCTEPDIQQEFWNPRVEIVSSVNDPIDVVFQPPENSPKTITLTGTSDKTVQAIACGPSGVFSPVSAPVYWGDSDGDGLADRWEMQYFGNLSQTASGDWDGDGLMNLQEYQNGTNPASYNGLLIFTPLD